MFSEIGQIELNAQETKTQTTAVNKIPNPKYKKIWV